MIGWGQVRHNLSIYPRAGIQVPGRVSVYFLMVCPGGLGDGLQSCGNPITTRTLAKLRGPCIAGGGSLPFVDPQFSDTTIFRTAGPWKPHCKPSRRQKKLKSLPKNPFKLDPQTKCEKTKQYYRCTCQNPETPLR